MQMSVVAVEVTFLATFAINEIVKVILGRYSLHINGAWGQPGE